MNENIERNFVFVFFAKKAIILPIPVHNPAKNVNKKAIKIFVVFILYPILSN